MRILPPRRDRGIALIIVMMVILVLSVLAGGFAYSMKVETKLARNSSWESDMEWLGRSGVELGKYALAMQLAAPAPDSMYSGLNQVWAGGPPNPTNEVLAAIQLKDHQLGPGKFTVTIQDNERKFNLAMVNEQNTAIFERALMMVGADSSDIGTIIDSYLDWIDIDDKPHLEGAEKEEYLSMPSPYCPKNGPVDDIRELLLLKGMTPQIFWGTARVGQAAEPATKKGRSPLRRPMSPYLQSLPQNQVSGVGLVDLFTTLSAAGPAVNVNTASAEVLQLVPGVDAALAQSIVSERNGPDGQPGTEDDTPFISVGEMFQNVPGFDPAMAGSMANLFTVQSQIFEITVDAEIGNYKRRFVALVHRRGRLEVLTLYFTWK
jgi:type II secretory pathway component PulK